MIDEIKKFSLFDAVNGNDEISEVDDIDEADEVDVVAKVN